ncbi:MAG: hypothetical protein R3C60_07365 [Parvularculaceae bacterium]
MRITHLGGAAFVITAIASAFAITPASAQVDHNATVTPAAAHGESGRVSGMGIASAPGIEERRERPLRLVKIPPGQEKPDPVLQPSPGPNAATTTPNGFAGLGQGDYGYTDQYAPPDTTLAVGPTQIVQWVNADFIVFDKATHAVLHGPVAGNTLFANLGGPCAANNDGDPIAQYDKLADRWVLTQFSVSSQPYMQCVAVSDTSDALGSYHLYAFSYGNLFNDYPKLGVWPDAYYITFNYFTNTFQGAGLCAYDRAAMLAGQPATQQCFQTSTQFGGLLPADVDSAAAPPPAGAPNPFISYGSNSLNLWRFHVDWANPGNTTLTGPMSIPVAAFTPACSGGGACITQPGRRVAKLDSLADRLMYRFAYRSHTAANTSETAVVNHSIKTGGNKKTEIVGVRWYQLTNLTSGTPAVVQQGTFSPDSTDRWMGSIAQDKDGNIALGYSASSSTQNPSIYFTGRLATDAPGTLQAESLLKAGGGAQGRTLSRWGDYSTMYVDPSDDCTFFYTTEYLKNDGTFNWSTWISSFKFPSCQ